jgi:hypothetical protein
LLASTLALRLLLDRTTLPMTIVGWLLWGILTAQAIWNW